MPHSYTSCLMHYVFSTKERQRIISPDLRERLNQLRNLILTPSM